MINLKSRLCVLTLRLPALCSCIDEVTSGRRTSRWSKGGSQWKAQSCFESSINFLEIVLSLLLALILCLGLEEYRKSRKLRERAKKDTARWHFMTFCLLHCESLLLGCRNTIMQEIYIHRESEFHTFFLCPHGVPNDTQMMSGAFSANSRLFGMVCDLAEEFGQDTLRTLDQSQLSSLYSANV